MMVRPAFLQCLLILLTACPVLADDKEYPPPPWHLVDLWWDIGQDQPFESYSIDVDNLVGMAKKSSDTMTLVAR